MKQEQENLILKVAHAVPPYELMLSHNVIKVNVKMSQNVIDTIRDWCYTKASHRE